MNYAPLVTVAQRLGPLRERVVFVGGMVRGLLITDAAASPFRPTDDVDLIVGVASRVAYNQLSKELRARGFREDTEPGASLCRWTVGGIKVDVMPGRRQCPRLQQHLVHERTRQPPNRDGRQRDNPDRRCATFLRDQDRSLHGSRGR